MIATEDIALLGLMLCEPGVIAEVSDDLPVETFEQQRQRKVYSAILALHHSGSAVSAPSVVSYLRENGGLQGIGEEFILSLPHQAQPPECAPDLARAIKIAAIDRELRLLGRSLSSWDGTPYDALDSASEVVARLSGAITPRSVRPVGDLVDEVMSEALKSDKKNQDIVSTGYEGLDRLIYGLHRGDLIILAARPSVGKTALALNIAANAGRSGKRVLVFSLEMAEKPLVQRLVSSESGVDFRRIAQSYLSRADKERLDQVKPYLLTLPIIIDDNSSITLHEMRARARREATTRGLDLIVIDYLQLLAPEDNKELAAVSRAIKQIARDINVPVVALSQFSRAPEKRDNKRPTLSDIRGSGQFEQDADVVLALWIPTADITVRRLEILKQRNGPLGYVDLLFSPNTVRFEGMGDNGYTSAGAPPEEETSQAPQAAEPMSDLDLAIARRKRKAQGA